MKKTLDEYLAKIFPLVALKDYKDTYVIFINVGMALSHVS